MSLRHGAYSPRTVDPLVAELVELTLADDDVGYLRAPSYRPGLLAWARAEVRAQLLTEYLGKAAEKTGDGVGDLKETRVLAAYRLLAEAERTATSGRARLGLDPLSRARLGRDVVAGQVDAAVLLTAWREAAEREQEGTP